jgi:hypothetical protein
MVSQVATTQEVEPPILITVAEAERLCGIPFNGGYKLIKNEWAGFVVRYGSSSRPAIRIIRAKLLEWANGQKAA